MKPKLFFRFVRLGFFEVLRHPLARVVLFLVLLGLGLYTYLTLQMLEEFRETPHALLAAERSLDETFRPVATYLWAVQLLLALPLFAGERFTGTLDSLWARPIPRGAFLLARCFGRSWYYPLFVVLHLLAAGFALIKHGLPLSPLAGPLVRYGLFGWLGVLVAMLLLLAFACLSSSRFLHLVYWCLAFFAHVQLQTFLAEPGGNPLVRKVVAVLAAVWSTLVVGASPGWLDSFYFSPWHLARVVLSLAVGLAANTVLVLYLARRAEVFHD